MVSLTINNFTSFEFTEHEILAATIFTELQLQHLYTQRAEAANQFITMEPTDFASREEYFIAQAEVRAYIKVYSMLIDKHMESSVRLQARRTSTSDGSEL